jgi:glycosyltransferase involved in cell wall biosynthesis
MMAAEFAAGPRRPLKIAIACPGIGLVQRGFERFCSDLFQVARNDFEVTLFKGAGSRSRQEKVLRFVSRTGKFVKILPVHKLVGRTPYHTECVTMALAMLPRLRGGAFDIVHTTDPPLTRILYKLRARLGLRFKLLYTEGCAMPPSDYPPADHTQQISPVTLEAALAFGHAPESMTLLPIGFFPERFAPSQDRAVLRRLYGIDENAFVVLSVAAINRDHKRTDYLIEETALLGGKALLLLDGIVDQGDPSLIDYAHQRLGERCRITHVASDKVGELYHLADVMVHSATLESFGLAIIEAASCGLPVITHNAPHFQWLVPNPECWVDMGLPGALAARLRTLMADLARRNNLRCASQVVQRFSWHRLRFGYADLYRHVSNLTQSSVAEADCRKAL